jgi:hypothetical protein
MDAIDIYLGSGVVIDVRFNLIGDEDVALIVAVAASHRCRRRRR